MGSFVVPSSIFVWTVYGKPSEMYCGQGSMSDEEEVAMIVNFLYKHILTVEVHLRG